MDKVQDLVRKSLEYYQFYNYHAIDFNIKESGMHKFTLPKDADFIVSNVFGEIGWVEVKNWGTDRFYVSKVKPHQWKRACILDEKYHTYYFIWYSDKLEAYYWFTPTLVTDAGGVFNPSELFEYRVPTFRVGYQDSYGHNRTRSVLNLLVIPFFYQSSNWISRHATKQVPESPLVESTEESP